MGDHKVYRNPPIAMVAVEIRHAGTDPLSELGYHTIRERLREQWPIQLPGQDITINFIGTNPSPTVIEYRRFASRDRRTAIAIKPGSTVVETVDYKGWDDLRIALRIALDARAEVSDPSGYDRVGLRYIDEVRVPNDDGSRWSTWLHPSLLAAQPDDSADLQLSDWQGMSTFRPTDGHTLVLRYGPRQGFAVEPNGQLKRPDSPTGPFFLLDIDSFWEASDGSIPTFSADELMTRCDNLHGPTRRLFEGLITDRLRKEVLDA